MFSALILSAGQSSAGVVAAAAAHWVGPWAGGFFPFFFIIPIFWILVIGLIVVVAALNNVRPLVLSRRWAVAFGFGLIHGFGFATVLAELGLPSDALLIALVGFNLGVEVGQLAIVALFLPLAYSLRRSQLYRRTVMLGGSVVIALIAAVWLVERAFGLSLLA